MSKYNPFIQTIKYQNLNDLSQDVGSAPFDPKCCWIDPPNNTRCSNNCRWTTCADNTKYKEKYTCFQPSFFLNDRDEEIDILFGSTSDPKSTWVDTYRCLAPDKKLCDIGKGIDDNSIMTTSWWNNINTGNQAVVCTYNANLIDTKTQVDNLKRSIDSYTSTSEELPLKFNRFDNINQKTRLDYLFCSGIVTDSCPLDPSTGKIMTSCSRLKSTGEVGNYCRSWFSNLNNIDKDSFKISLCLNNPDISECECISRSFKDTFYPLLKNSNPFNDACWYKQCSNSELYWTTSDLNTTNCPDNICQTVYNFINNNNINISDVQNNIQCNLTNLSPKLLPVVGVQTQVKNAIYLFYDQIFNKKNPIYFSILTFIVLIIIIAPLILYYNYSKKK